MSVLDTSAVLAMLYEEGADKARAASDVGSISQINLAEVLTDLLRSGYRDVAQAMLAFDELQLQVRGVDDGHVQRVAELKQVRGLSLGDCFCIALGESSGQPLVTADRQWATLDLAVPVELIR